MYFLANVIFNETLDFPKTEKDISMALPQSPPLIGRLKEIGEHIVNTSLHLPTCFPLLFASHFSILIQFASY